MYLKSLEIFGFKSFADKTKISFEPGITAIVGPNGCGKSNVVDSIKWVLGEKKAKNIRGEKMEDVIFTGTEHRKPVSLAEVSVQIENNARVLAFDSDEVTITRRVFRDGESEYLINKSPVRLKDIEELLMDTGIGKSSYSVMEQGKIDMILSTKAEDRRYIFEEAAGISKFKVQKADSLKKLQDTGDNLERIKDIISEIEREKDLKARQAEKTKKYLALREELKHNDLKIQILKYRELDRKHEKLKGVIEKLHVEREELAKKMTSISSENEKDEKLKNDIQLSLFELEKKIHTYKIKVEDFDQRTDRNKQLIKEQIGLQENQEKKLKERQQNLKENEDEKKRTVESGVTLKSRMEEDRQRLEGFFETRKRKIDSIHNYRDTIERNKKEIIDRNSNLVTLRESLEVVIKRLIDAIEKRKAELSDDEQARQALSGHITKRFSELDSSIDEARSCLRMGLTEDASRILGTMNFSELSADFKRFEAYEDGIRSILFDKTGIHAQKEDLDSKINSEEKAIEALRSDINQHEINIRHDQQELEDINGLVTKVEKDIARDENEKIWLEKHLHTLDLQISDLNKQIDSLQEETKRSQQTIERLNEEIQSWADKLVEFNERSVSLLQEISECNQKIKQIEDKIVHRRDDSRKEAEQMNKIIDRITEQERGLVEFNFKLTNIEEYLWTEYERKVKQLDDVKVDELEYNIIQENIQRLKKEIDGLGLINNLAIEEFNDLKKRFEYYQTQRKDIEKARNDIIGVIDEINTTSVNMFLDTFKDIQRNFAEIFKQLFEGGEASLLLQDDANVLECGIEIVVRPPGKKPKNINLLSGGERSLTAIALLFATYMVKPSPFCFLDEIDAALDEGNVGRFLNMLKQFSKRTQFIVVTHNKKTMSVGESIYGVTMEEPGVSKLVSLKLERVEAKSN